MAYQKITLTQNGEYIAMRSGSHKTDVISCNIAGTFANNASLIETTALTTKENEIGRQVPFRDGNGTQIEISESTQYARSASVKNRWYILTIQGASGTTNIEFDIEGVEIKYSETAIVEIL